LQKPLLYLASGRPLAIGFYFDWRCRTDPLTSEFHQEISSLFHSGVL
jgi:hypothetical protein